jgi:hypothetical protein
MLSGESAHTIKAAGGFSIDATTADGAQPAAFVLPHDGLIDVSDRDAGVRKPVPATQTITFGTAGRRA